MTGPHHDQPVVTDGPPLTDATAAVVLVHGRGATARSILQMGQEFAREGVTYLAPQAAGNAWYPHSFLAPVERNEPGRSSGLQQIEDILTEASNAGVPKRRVLLCGFSQGGCLASEFIAQNPAQYGGLAALSGGLIGETIDTDNYDGTLEGTPIFLGCSDSDPHIPEQRVHETADVFERLSGDVDTHIYPNMAHTVNEDELDAVSALLDGLLAESQ